MAWKDPVKPGDPISARYWNEVVRRVAGASFAPGSIFSAHEGMAQRRLPIEELPAAPAGTLRMARITDHSGTAPYRYSAEEVTILEGAGASGFSIVVGSDATGDQFFNFAELAGSNCPAKHVPNGAIVFFTSMPNGWHYFTFENLGGVYG
jgi:hypothetical protein